LENDSVTNEGKTDPEDDDGNVSRHCVEKDKPFRLMQWPSNGDDHPTDDGPLALDHSFIFIRCGPMKHKSAGTIKITRLPSLHICPTHLSPKEHEDLVSLASLIGAHVSSGFDPLKTNLVVSDSQEKTANVICAFVQNVPIVNMDYVKALTERKKVQDPLPQVQEFAWFKEAADMPWTMSDSLSEQRKICMKGFKVLSLFKADADSLVLCTGGTLVSLYDIENWMTDEWWDQLQQDLQEDPCTIIWLDCTKSKVKTSKKFLVEKMKQLKENKLSRTKFQIFCVHAGAIAQRIKSLELLKDVDGTALLPGNMIPEECSKLGANDSSGSMEVENAEEPNTLEQSKSHSLESTRKRDISHLSAKVTKPKSTGWISSQRQTKATSEDDDNMNRKKQKVVDERSQEDMTQPSHMETIERSEATIVKKAKLPLPVGKDGWLKAAPRGEKRALYRASFEEQESGMTYEAAPSEVRTNLIVRTIMEQSKSVQVSEQTKSVTDYKRFKKNPIIQGSKMHLSKVNLTAMITTESERFAQLQKSQRELEKRERDADALFSGIDSSMKGTSKQRAGGIRNYFQ